MPPIIIVIITVNIVIGILLLHKIVLFQNPQRPKRYVRLVIGDTVKSFGLECHYGVLRH